MTWEGTGFDLTIKIWSWLGPSIYYFWLYSWENSNSKNAKASVVGYCGDHWEESDTSLELESMYVAKATYAFCNSVMIQKVLVIDLQASVAQRLDSPIQCINHHPLDIKVQSNLQAHTLLGTTTRFHRYLPWAHLYWPWVYK